MPAVLLLTQLMTYRVLIDNLRQSATRLDCVEGTQDVRALKFSRCLAVLWPVQAAQPQAELMRVRIKLWRPRPNSLCWPLSLLIDAAAAPLAVLTDIR